MPAGEIEKLYEDESYYRHYCAVRYKYGWEDEHAQVFLHLLLELYKDGTISEDNVTDEVWLRIQNGLQNSTNCSFEIDFLKERLCDYKKFYSVLAHTRSPHFYWDRKNNTIINTGSDWSKYHPELLIFGLIIWNLDTLVEVCSLLEYSRRFSEQEDYETSTDINEKLLHQDIPQPSNIRTKFWKSLKRLFMCICKVKKD